MVKRNRVRPMKGGKRSGKGFLDTIKKSGIVSGLASHIPVVGGVASALLGALGLGKRRGRGRTVALHTSPNASSYGAIRT